MVNIKFSLNGKDAIVKKDCNTFQLRPRWRPTQTRGHGSVFGYISVIENIDHIDETNSQTIVDSYLKNSFEQMQFPLLRDVNEEFDQPRKQGRFVIIPNDSTCCSETSSVVDDEDNDDHYDDTISCATPISTKTNTFASLSLSPPRLEPSSLVDLLELPKVLSGNLLLPKF